MATNLTDWAPELLPEISNLPFPMIENAVRNAAIRFCEQTHLWRYTLDAISVVASTSEYTLTIPPVLNAKLEIVPEDGVSYKQDGEDNDQYTELGCTSEEAEKERCGGDGWKYETHPYPSKFYVDNIDKHVHLVPIPSTASADGLLVDVIIKPKIDTTDLPDFIYDDHRDGITKGALSYLFKMKNMPWYDPNEYLKNENLFLDHCGTAKWKKHTGGTNKPVNVTIPFFG